MRVCTKSVLWITHDGHSVSSRFNGQGVAVINSSLMRNNNERPLLAVECFRFIVSKVS